MKADETKIGEVFRGNGLVHVAGTGVEPRAATVGRAGPGSGLRQTKLHQVLGSRPVSLPLPPQNGTQLSTNPAIECLEHSTDFTFPEIGYPANQFGTKLLKEEPQVTAPASTELRSKFTLESFDRFRGDFQLGLEVVRERVAQELTLSRMSDATLFTIDHQT